MGADASCPIAAATRSSDRIVAYPIVASLSVWLRSLFVVTAAVRSGVFFFEEQAIAPRVLPYAEYWLTLPGHSNIRNTPSLFQHRPSSLQHFSLKARTQNSDGILFYKIPRHPVLENSFTYRFTVMSGTPKAFTISFGFMVPSMIIWLVNIRKL